MRTLFTKLLDVQSGKLSHVYAGSCLDEVQGLAARDPGCRACHVLIEAAAAATDTSPEHHVAD